MNIRFTSSNQHKIDEVQSILKDAGVNIIPYKQKINEIQTNDMQAIVEDKLLKAFKKICRPIFVEHTGLYIKNLNDFPAGLTQIFWDTLGPDLISKLFGQKDNEVIAKTIIGYCDCCNIHFFEGNIEGVIASSPKGNRAFQWDCVFIPNGYTQTFAEMGQKKNDISMRRKALDKFCTYLKK